MEGIPRQFNAYYLNSFSAGSDFSRQILTTKVAPRTVRVKIFILAVDTWHTYSTEPEGAN